ncbi:MULTISPECIES: VC0807 family protein [unclassified Nocardia]|uniref:VC0807 family protein n=1 Tax=unclassified Nocardia TaxID=2637762 RepID=UPI001CE4078A|nr:MULTISPECIES: VC0807 family protein [unclassified Nocardia]
MTTISTESEQVVANPMRPNLLTMLRPIALDVGLPLVAYYGATALGYSDFTGLLAGSMLSAALLGYQAIRARKLDGMSVLMLAIFGFGLASSLITGDPRMMIVKDSAGTFIVGVVILVSVLIGKPLTYYGARKMISSRGPAALAAFEEKVRTIPAVRKSFDRSGILWGAGLSAESVVRVVLAYQLPVHTMVWLSTVLMVGTIAGLMVVSIVIGKRNRDM